MNYEPVEASRLQVGDPIGLPDLMGWWLVEQVRHTDDHIVLGLAPIDRGDPIEWVIGRHVEVRKGAREAVHKPAEFIGLTLPEARVWAAALGWHLFGPGDFQFGGDSVQRDTIRVRTNESDVVIDAAFL